MEEEEIQKKSFILKSDFLEALLVVFLSISAVYQSAEVVMIWACLQPRDLHTVQTNWL